MNTNFNNLHRLNLRKAVRAIALVLPVVGMLSTLATGVRATTPLLQDLETQAIRTVATENGLATGELSVLNSALAQYPLQGKSSYDYKIMDKHTGAIYGVALDASSRELDGEKMQADEMAAYTAKYEKLDPALAEILPKVPANQPITVSIWLKEPPYTGPQRPAADAQMSEVQIDALYTQADAQRANAVRNVVAPIANRLVGLGFATTGDPYTPMLHASLTPASIKQLNGWSEVDRVYMSETYEPTVDIGRYTIGSNVVQGWGYSGTGIKLGQTEVGGRVAVANPYLSGVSQGTAGGPCASASNHSTAVAGIMVSTHSDVRGIAPAATLRADGACVGIQAPLQNASTDTANWGARSINLSFGTAGATTPDSMARFYDGMVRNRWRTIVIAAGNNGLKPQPLLGNPALAYNAISVGSFYDNHNSNWVDDVMSGFSSWKNPTTFPHHDREMPQLAAPGGGGSSTTGIHSTTTSSPWIATSPSGVGSGTSYAAPMVNGAVGQLIQRKPSLSIWPEIIKAILMATAVHDIHSCVYDPANDCKDGVGGVAIDRADQVAQGNTNVGTSGGLAYNCTAPNDLTVTTMPLTAGVRTRIVFNWDTNDSYGAYSNEPSADLDLYVSDPANNVVASSGSWDNNTEFIDFIPTVTGNYTLHVTKFRCIGANADPGWAGWAWYKY